MSAQPLHDFTVAWPAKDFEDYADCLDAAECEAYRRYRVDACSGSVYARWEDDQRNAIVVEVRGAKVESRP